MACYCMQCGLDLHSVAKPVGIECPPVPLVVAYCMGCAENEDGETGCASSTGRTVREAVSKFWEENTTSNIEDAANWQGVEVEEIEARNEAA